MKTLYVIIALTALTGLVSCGYLSESNTGYAVNNLNLDDISGSIDATVYKGYINSYLNNIYSNLEIQDNTIKFPIDGASASLASVLYEDEFSAMDFLKHENIVTHAEDTIRARFLRYKHQKFARIRDTLLLERKSRAKHIHYTDIINSLINVQKFLVNDTNKESAAKTANSILTGHKTLHIINLLVINSDMINCTKGDNQYNFYYFRSLTHAEIVQRVNLLEKQGLIADLKNCNVIVNGAAVEDGNEVLYSNIEYFWSEYFKRSGAKLLAYDYNSDEAMRKFFTNLKRD